MLLGRRARLKPPDKRTDGSSRLETHTIADRSAGTSLPFSVNRQTGGKSQYPTSEIITEVLAGAWAERLEQGRADIVIARYAFSVHIVGDQLAQALAVNERLRCRHNRGYQERNRYLK